MGTAPSYSTQVNRSNEPATSASPGYNVQPNITTTRAGRIDSPVAASGPRQDFFNPTSEPPTTAFAPQVARPSNCFSYGTVEPSSGSATTLRSGPMGPQEGPGSSYDSRYPGANPSYMPSQQANAQPASGFSGALGMAAAASGNGYQTQVGSGMPGSAALAGGAVVGGSAHALTAGGAQGTTLLVAPEGQGPTVKAGRLDADAAPFVPPPSIKTNPPGVVMSSIMSCLCWTSF